MMDADDRAAAREKELLWIEKELKEYGFYSGLEGVELTWADWVLIQSESEDLATAIQAAIDCIDMLYKQRK